MWSLDHVVENQLEIVRLTITDEPIVDPPVVPLPAAAWMGLVMFSGMGVISKMRGRRHAA